MKYLPTRVFSCLLIVACTSCAASDEDCARLGDKFVELYKAGLSEESKKLSPEVLDNAAEAGRAEIVDQCKKQTYSRASVDRCLGAETMEEFKNC